MKSGNGVTLFSRRRKSLNSQFPYIVEALADLPAGTVVDGEVVTSMKAAAPTSICRKIPEQNLRDSYYIFDLLCWKDRDLTRLPLIERRELLKSVVALHHRESRFRITSRQRQGLLSAVRAQELEGIIGKRKDSCTNRENEAVRGSSIA